MENKRNLTNDIFKAGLIGLLAVIINLIPLERIFGVALTDFGVMPTIYLLPMFFVYGIIALVFTAIRRNLNLDRNTAFFTIFTFYFVISTLLSNIEGQFYLSNYPFAFNLINGLLLNFIITLAIFRLWKEDTQPVDIKMEIRSYFSSRSILGWAWRVIVILLLFYIFIMILGIVTYPVTGHYLEDGLMRTPTMLELFNITLFRSLVYLLVTLPLIIFWKAGNKSLFLHLSLIHILIYPVLGDGFAYFWPPVYRLVDGLVLAVHVTLMSWFYVSMLKRGSNPEVRLSYEAT